MRYLHSIYVCLILCLMGVIVSSCHSSKSVTKTQTINTAKTSTTTTKATTKTTSSSAAKVSSFDADKFIKKIESNVNTQECLTAKVKVVVDVAGKSTSTNGSLKMKRNDVIQLSLVDPILGAVELGRMEFTKDHVLIIDRVNKQYIDVPYSDVPFLKKANIDFDVMQSLFWNEIFEPGKSSVKASDFTVDESGNTNVELYYKDQMLTYQFSADKTSGQLKKTYIKNPKDTKYKFDFAYNSFDTFMKGVFPKEMAMSFVAGSQTTTLAMTLSSMKNTSDWTSRSSVPSKYTKANPETIFKQLVK